MNFAAQLLDSRTKKNDNPRKTSEDYDPFWQRPPAALASDSSLLPGPPLLPPFQTVVALLLRLALSLVLLLFFSDEERSAGSKQGSPCCEGLCQKDGPIRSSHTLHHSASIAPERLKDFGEEEYLNGDVKSWEMKIVGLPKRLLGDAAEPQKPAEPRPTRAQNPPAFIRFEDISAAAFKIQRGVQKTPCTYSRLSKQYGVELFLKKEHLHYTCSVKERGVLSLLTSLRQDQQKKGVIVASDSNFSMAVAHHASELSIPVFVIMAANAPPSRPKTCREYGAMVISYGSTPRDSQSHAQRLARENGYLYIEEEDSTAYLAGLGTMGLEMYEQVPKLDAVILPAGGHCGLLAGTAAALKHLNPRITVIGVEPEDCPLLQQSLKLGYPIKELHSTANRKLYGDLVGPPFGNNAFLLAKKLVDKVITVREEDVLVSMLRFQEYERATIDPEGAIGLAAILAGKLPELQGKRVAIAVCSASMELPLLRQCVDRALALDGRVSKFAVQLGEWPGDTAKLLDLLAREGVRLLDISHEKQFTSSSVFNVQVSCVVETRDRQQTTQLRNVLTERYTTLCWHEQ